MKQESPRKATQERDLRIRRRVRAELQRQFARAPILTSPLDFKNICEREESPPIHHSELVPYGKVCRLNRSFGHYKGLWVNSKWLGDIVSVIGSSRLGLRQRAMAGLADPEVIESDMRMRSELAQLENRIRIELEKEKQGRDQRLAQPTEAKQRDAFIRLLWKDLDLQRSKSKTREIAARLDANKFPVPKTWLARGAGSWVQAYGKPYIRPLLQKLISKAAQS